MKKILTYAFIVASIFCFGSTHAVEVKEVCHEKLDKAGKVIKDKKGEAVLVCKKIKVHKKLEGTTIPEKKKK
jgi:hypothetical protein